MIASFQKTSALIIDRNQARTQLELLGYKPFDNVYMRFFVPDGDHRHGTPAAARKANKLNWEEVERYQNDGYGVYFVVNGGGHTDKNVQQGRALFCEWDDRPIEDQIFEWQNLNLPEPSLQVGTRKSVHNYWRADLTLEQWIELQEDLLAYTQSDQKLKNPSRVLRLAGAYHIKPECEPIRCDILHQSDKVFTYDELRFAIPRRTQPESSNIKFSTINHSPSITDDVPLYQFLTKDDRALIDQGSGQGERNSSGAKLARNLIGTAQRLNHLGIRFDGEPRQLFDDYCHRCSPSLAHREAESIWKSALKNNPTPSLTDDALENCAKAWLRNQQKLSKRSTAAVGNTAKEQSAAVTLLEEKPNKLAKAEFLQTARNLLYGDKPWISVNGKLYCWNGSYYEYQDEGLELRRIAKFCDSYPVVTEDGIRFPYAKPAKVDELLKWAKYHLKVDENLVNPPGINCTNGVLLIEWAFAEKNLIPTWRLVPHNPDFYYVYKPFATYDPEADTQACDRLLQVLDAPQQDIFLKTIAASLDLATIRQYKGRMVRGLLLKGHGSNGKDTLREAVSMMYGRQGMTGCTLSDFASYDEGRKFPLSRLRHSRCNWASENANTTRLDKIQSLKAFITGDTLSAEGKGRDEDEFTPTGIALFNVNDTPKLQGTLEAIASRYGILSFVKTFKIGANTSLGELEADPRFKYDPNFLQTEVLPAFLNRVLDALQRLMSEGIDYSCTQKALEDIQAENSHLFQFCQDTGLGYNPKGVQTAGEIWERLEQWYQNNGTLTYEESANGKQKAMWVEQALRGDYNIKGANQIIPRFQQLFPQAKRITVGKGNMALMGISFAPTPPGSGEPVEPISEAIVSQSVSLNPLPDKDGEPVEPVFQTEDELDNESLNPQPTFEFEPATISSTADQDDNLPGLSHHPDTVRDVASPTASLTASPEAQTASPEVLNSSSQSSALKNDADSGLVISFGKVLPPLLSGEKTVTRRTWQTSHASKFVDAYKNGMRIRAFDKSPRIGGKQVGWLTLTEEPLQERLDKMPATDLAAEGFADLTLSQFADQFFDGVMDTLVWVIRFSFENMTASPTINGEAVEDVELAQPSDPWLEPEHLLGMAQTLEDACPDSDTLANLRAIWPSYALNAACKLLSPEKHAQIKQWVVKLTAAKEVFSLEKCDSLEAFKKLTEGMKDEAVKEAIALASSLPLRQQLQLWYQQLGGSIEYPHGRITERFDQAAGGRCDVGFLT